MSGLAIYNIENWDYATFEEWLSQVNVDSDENQNVEFKEEVQIKGKECRKDFSGLANAIGGYIIFGVRDGTKALIGIEANIDFENRIADHLNPNCIDPEVQWNTVKKFQIPNTQSQKYIYVVKVNQTFPFWKRPHICDGAIYIRRHGKTEPIRSLIELRQNYFQKNNFIPEDITYLDTLIKDLKDSQYEVDSIDFVTVRLWIGIKQYLTDEIHNGLSGKKRALSNELRALYQKISEHMEEIKKQKSRTTMITGISTISSNDTELKRLIQTVCNDLAKFNTNFARYLNI